jgi:hypothetical protein
LPAPTTRIIAGLLHDGLEQTITPTMIPGQLPVSITIASLWEGVGPTLTIHFTARRIIP